jgi:membrane fusion protein, multidrug efflux system
LKRWLYMAGAVAALVIVLAAVKGLLIYRTIQGFKSQGVPKVTITAARAVYSDWQPTLSTVASLHAVHGADLSAEVAGIVAALDFESGQYVKAGQLLLRLRAADDLAHLQALKAAADLLQITYQRDQAQLAIQAVSQATVDTDAANLKAALAQVDEQQAVFDKKMIRAPFSGRVGIRAVDAGQFVAAGTKLVTLQALDPIYADFFLPQQDLARLSVGQRVTLSTDALAEQSFAGTIEAISPQVDTGTRNVQVRARLRNPGQKLLPGMYGRVSVDTDASQRLLTLPQTAVTYNAYGAAVFVIRPGQAGSNAAGVLKATQQFVETGATRGDQVAITRGLQEGDLVATSGQLKLKNGDQVVVNNAVTPLNDENPQPPNE